MTACCFTIYAFLLSYFCCSAFFFNRIQGARVLGKDWGRNLTFLDFIATSPTVCFRDTDCLPSQYCTADFSGLLKPLFRCLLRPGEGDPCNRAGFGYFFDPSECKPGLYCPSREKDYIKARPLGPKCNPFSGPNTCPEDHVCSYATETCIPPDRCVKQLSIGSHCYKHHVGACANNAICNSVSNTCMQRGSNGTLCSNHDECTFGFRCNTSGICEHQKKDGEPCIPFTRDCIHYCDETISKCVPYVPEGGKCGSQLCVPPELLGLREHIVCNMPDHTNGVCVRESRLIKRPGRRCNPKADRCDSLRGLACGWMPQRRRHVCLLGISSHGYGYCAPGNTYSKCFSRGDEPRRECRRYKYDSKNYYGVEEERFFSCQDRNESST